MKQTMMPLEVIVVDDTPVNEIKALCEDYSVKFKLLGIELTYIKNWRERSLTIARNIGAKMTKGDIIMFFDSDVVLDSKYMEKILDVYQNYPNAKGVEGWITNVENPRLNPLEAIIELIFDVHDKPVKDKCKYNRYPISLSRIINCEHLEGATMSFKRQMLDEFQFDESLRKYCFTEDWLFGSSVRKRYANSLYITPHAKCIHKWSRQGRDETKEFGKLKRAYLQYAMTKVFGFKGAFVFFKQETGRLLLGAHAKVSKLVKR